MGECDPAVLGQVLGSSSSSLPPLSGSEILLVIMRIKVGGPPIQKCLVIHSLNL